ncbi:hypothetical protein NM688_g5020 [Phlebia brevispora]|uniref:Uncharacterized protein n=1 Tax=Phlebia brevispora TaxID=194682 RepID=A0ACC1T1B5_9APHY|nr:hypothetical protein NM688_g5020 [Phlebia brevispora]
MYTASQVLYGMRNTRNIGTSVVIAAYRKDPEFTGDITWEMALAVTPFDGRPCQTLWDEGTIRYHISPQHTEDGETTWSIDCFEGAHCWGRPPVFLVGLGLSNYTEEDVWDNIKDIPIQNRGSLQDMYKNWVWDSLPALADAKAIYSKYGRADNSIPRTGNISNDGPVLNMLGRPVAKCKSGERYTHAVNECVSISLVKGIEIFCKRDQKPTGSIAISLALMPSLKRSSSGMMARLNGRMYELSCAQVMIDDVPTFLYNVDYFRQPNTLESMPLDIYARTTYALPLEHDHVNYYEAQVSISGNSGAVITLGLSSCATSIPRWNVRSAFVYADEDVLEAEKIEERAAPLFRTQIESCSRTILGIGLDLSRKMVFVCKNSTVIGLAPISLAQIQGTTLFPTVIIEGEDVTRLSLRANFDASPCAPTTVNTTNMERFYKIKVAHPELVQKLKDGYEHPAPQLRTTDALTESKERSYTFRVVDYRLDIYPTPTETALHYFEIKITAMSPGGLVMIGFMMYRQSGPDHGEDYLAQLELQERHWAWYSDGRCYVPYSLICGRKGPTFSGYRHRERYRRLRAGLQKRSHILHAKWYFSGLVHIQPNFGNRPYLYDLQTLRASLADVSISRWPVLAPPLHLPSELMDMVLSHLNLAEGDAGDIGPYWEYIGTICSCRLVCKRWAQRLIPYLFKTVAIGSTSSLKGLCTAVRAGDREITHLVHQLGILDKSGGDAWAYQCSSLPHELTVRPAILEYTGNFARDMVLKTTLKKARIPPQISTHPGLPFSHFSGITSLSLSLYPFRSFAALSRFVVTFRVLENLSLFNTLWPDKPETPRLVVASETLRKLDFVPAGAEPETPRPYCSQLVLLYLAERRAAPQLELSARRPVVDPIDLDLVCDLVKQLELETDDFDAERYDVSRILRYNTIEDGKWSLSLTSEYGYYSWCYVFSPVVPGPSPIEHAPRVVVHFEELRIGMRARKRSGKRMSMLFQVLQRTLPHMAHFKTVQIFRKPDEVVIELENFEERSVELDKAAIVDLVKRCQGIQEAREVLCRYWVNNRGEKMFSEEQFDEIIGEVKDLVESEDEDSESDSDETDENEDRTDVSTGEDGKDSDSETEDTDSDRGREDV